jgi:hypothetical protein
LEENSYVLITYSLGIGCVTLSVPLSCFFALPYDVAVDGLFSPICCSLAVLNDTVFAFMLVFIFILSGMVWYYCNALLMEWSPDIFLE